jgi:hypothetical protein
MPSWLLTSDDFVPKSFKSGNVAGFVRRDS